MPLRCFLSVPAELWALVSVPSLGPLLVLYGHTEAVSIKTCTMSIMCKHCELNKAMADGVTHAFKYFLSLNLQNVGVDRSREEALRTVPNHL